MRGAGAVLRCSWLVVLTIVVTVGLSFALAGSGYAQGDGEADLPAHTVTAADYQAYAPFLSTTPPPGLYGRVSVNGTATSGIPLELWFYNGSSWSILTTTSTGADGSYLFAGLSSLAAGQFYVVSFTNPSYNSSLLSSWDTRYLNVYTAGASVPMGNFDVANVVQSAPSSGAVVTLPYTFSWIPRPATPTDSYRFYLMSLSSDLVARSGSLGYASSFTVPYLPSDFSAGVQYGWYIVVYSPDGGVGLPYYFRRVTFTNTNTGSAAPSALDGVSEQPSVEHWFVAPPDALDRIPREVVSAPSMEPAELPTGSNELPSAGITGSIVGGGYDPKYTDVRVLNLDTGASVSMGLDIYGPSSSTPVLSRTSDVNALGGKSFNQQFMPLPASFTGAGIVSSPSPLLAMVNIAGSHTMMGYTAATEGATEVFLPAIFKNAYAPWTTNFSIQNTGASTATVTMTYYDLNGATVGAPVSDTIPPAASHIYDQGTIAALGSFFAGSVKITSSQPMVAEVNEESPSAADFAAYSGFPTTSASTTVYCPSVLKRAWGWYSDIRVQNITNTATNVRVTFYDSNGLEVHHIDENILPYSAKGFNELAIPALPNGFAGTATIVSDAQPIVAVVNEVHETGAFLSYEGFSDTGASNTIYTPSVLKNAWGWFTDIRVMNTGSGEIPVTVKFYNFQGALVATVPGAVPGHSVTSFNETFIAGLPNGFEGWAEVSTTSITNDIVAIVNEMHSTGKGIAYGGINSAPVGNHAPVANDQSIGTAIDSAKAITLSATDVDGDTLTYSVVNPPLHGGLTGSLPNITYTPAGSYAGSDSFTFKANDGTVDSNIATVSILVSNSVGTPTLVAPAADDTLAKATFDWSDVAGATGYRFQVSTYSSFSSTVVSQNVASSQYAYTSDLDGSYYWRACALSGAYSFCANGRVVQLVDYGDDDDGDALPNGWELHGYDADDNGAIDIDLPALGASYRHKDVFVEMDYMYRASATNLLAPNSNVMNTIISSFANAPVTNPDGVTGITMHLDLSNQVPYDDDLNPYATEFAALKTANFPAVRTAVYRYMIWANGHSGGTSSGVAMGIPATGFVVTLGKWHDNAGGTDYEKIGTFIHELGHTLGLMHGGSDHVNYKPNFISLMNYFFQMSGVSRNGSWYNWTYQPFALPALNETSLSEPAGLNAGAVPAGYATAHYCPSSSAVLDTNAAGAIDWTCNGSYTQTGLSLDVNSDDAVSTLAATPNEWTSLVYHGGYVIGSGLSVDELLRRVQGGYTPLPFEELTWEEEQRLSELRQP